MQRVCIVTTPLTTFLTAASSSSRNTHRILVPIFSRTCMHAYYYWGAHTTTQWMVWFGKISSRSFQGPARYFHWPDAHCSVFVSLSPRLVILEKTGYNINSSIIMINNTVSHCLIHSSEGWRYEWIRNAWWWMNECHSDILDPVVKRRVCFIGA